MEIKFLIFLNFFDVISKFFNLFSLFFKCFFSMIYLSILCLFYIFAFLCFVVLFHHRPSESTLVKMGHCWKSHVAAHLFCKLILIYGVVNSLLTIEERETKHMDSI